MPKTKIASPDSAVAVMVLAAGQGKRMKSDLPKVLHSVAGRPMLLHVLHQIQESLPGASVSIVVGHGREQVQAAVKADAALSAMDLQFVHQPEQLGTGHAARCAMESDWGEKVLAEKRTVLVLPGDLPLISVDLLRQISDRLSRSSVMRVLSCVLENPTGYGRIVRRGKAGPILRIVEEKDASAREREIHEVGTSIYLFQGGFLRQGLGRLSTRNAQAEFYLTDLVSQASRAGRKIEVLTWGEPRDLRGVNDLWELSQASRLLNERILMGWAQKGVRFLAPESTWVDSAVTFKGTAEVHPNVILRGSTQIGSGAILKAGTIAEDSRVGAEAQIGPYAHLRPESDVGDQCKVGNFVELKKTRLGRKTSVAHLSYLGDAEVGERVNIGCGFVTCNYDGRTKNRTVIGDRVFLGSDCQAVAPVTIGEGAYIASGSTITEDVEPGSLAIARSRQINKPGYAKKYGK